MKADRQDEGPPSLEPDPAQRAAGLEARGWHFGIASATELATAAAEIRAEAHTRDAHGDHGVAEALRVIATRLEAEAERRAAGAPPEWVWPRLSEIFRIVGLRILPDLSLPTVPAREPGPAAAEPGAGDEDDADGW